jgi:hypothetical protein
MAKPGSGSPTAGGTAGWMLVQMHEGLAECSRELHDAVLQLSGVHRLMPDVARVARSATTIGQVKETVARAHTLIEIIAELAEALPWRGVDATHAQVARAAVNDLRQGILNVDRVRWASGLLPAADGWPVLADALELADPMAWWGETSVGELLSSFRDVPPNGVRDVLRYARLDARAVFSTCTSDEIEALRDALRVAAPEE